jgi:hypothetical protein
MSASSAADHEFFRLLWAACDNQATADECAHLEQRVLDDPEACRAYVLFMSLHTDLLWQNQTSEPGSNERTEAIEQRPLATTSRNQQSEIRNQKLQSPILGFLGRTVSALNRPVVWSIVVVAAVFYGTFTVISWNLRPDKLPSVSNRDDVSVAVVRDAKDVQWSKKASSQPAESSILSGEPLKIDSGTMELELHAGTRLVVQGPAEWSISDSNSVSLRIGKLFARVPKQAIGFTVETPTAEIVDLGTEFGVEVSESGATEVQVSKGSIELYSGAKSSRLLKAPSVRLSAGAARRVEAVDDRGNYSVREITSVPDRFASLIPSATEGPIVVHDAIASSTDSVASHRARYLVNGRGLTGDAHANSSVGTMWHSATGEAKGVFVLFDLGLPYQLKAMKVWNHNDQQYDGFRSSGVKQADIYVSSSGTGSPLSHPKNWKLIVADQQFALATGKSDYSAPDAISLPNAEARYVAIVIDEAWRLPSRVAAPLFKFGAPQSVKFDESTNKSAMYGSEFVTSAPLAVTALGAWVSEKYRVANRTQSEYAATLYRVQGESLQLEKRVTIPVGTDIDSSGFAFIPVSLKLEANTSYAVAAHLGNTVVRKTPYCYGLDVGKFGYGTRFVRSRYAHTDEDKVLPLSSTEILNLGPLIGGNLLIQPPAEAADPADQNVEIDGVGLSEVQFFGTRTKATSADQ